MATSRIFIGLGANLTPVGYGNPREGCVAALSALAQEGVYVEKISNWYESAPVPVSDQPWYLNAVAIAKTKLDASQTLAAMHQTEVLFGRVRGLRNEARVLDMDLIDFDGLVISRADLTLPHPRLHDRAFVLLPLRELSPNWKHPVTCKEIGELISALPAEQKIRLAIN
ncbi:2-amino-4-hydroxy-6-hydroxymethyldihydropteridine diphosphokinase [Candidatus Puniceispirillum sp.]|nr:2-amino-4-hydroxy-6-hydroxymethyldihydropteridine diphosphokinase [Candidatus Puniceispirillum sp.]